jgi:cobalt-zinc-cadmium efflux system membrane fusion protein
MKLGNPEPVTFTQSVTANGYIAAAPNGKVNISSLIPGRVKKINIRPGEKVSRGQLLFTLEGNEIIQIQQDYAESYNQLILLKANYDRNKELAKENITARKDLLLAETDYNTMLAKKEGLKALLLLVNIDPAAIEKGSILPDISVYSPINGYITDLLFEVGEFVDENNTIAEIIDPDQLQLDISVFKQDIENLSKGQTVRFYDPDKPEKVYEAVLLQTGQTIDVESRTIHCTAGLKTEDRLNFINNTFVETEIITCSRQAPSLPESSLFTEEGKYFVLTLADQDDKQLVFKKTLVNTGAVLKGLVEIIDKDISDVLIEGVYNLVE